MNFKPGQRIKVKPVIFYPKGEKSSRLWTTRWEEFHQGARAKFHAMLKGRDTFELSETISFHGAFTAKEYASFCFSFDGLKHPDELGEDEECSSGVGTMFAELLTNHPALNQYTRYALPYCLSILFIDTNRDWVGGGGRVYNGDLNLGGGISVIPQWQYDDGKLMSTLIHELGHAFGLTHCWQRPVKNRLLKSCYYQQWTSRSIMAYSSFKETNATEVSQIPGWLLGDEIHALSQNKWVFPKLYFDADNDFDCPPKDTKCPPHDGTLHPHHQGPMHLFYCTTSQKSNFGNITFILNDQPNRWILSSHPAIGFNHEHMWHSPEVNEEGWVSFDVVFPLAVTLNRILFYTEYGGDTHRAEMIQIEAQKNSNSFSFIERVATSKADTEMIFNVTTSNKWRFAFKAGSSRHVVIRGMRFFANNHEIYPPLGPWATTTFGATQGTLVHNLVAIQRIISPNGGVDMFNRNTMWMSDRVNASGWVSIEVVFPTEVNLDQLIVYPFSMHRPKQVQIEVSDSKGIYQFVHRQAISGVHKEAHFKKTKGKAWKLAFEGEKNGFIIIRGLRFLIGNEEFYPPAQINP